MPAEMTGVWNAYIAAAITLMAGLIIGVIASW